MPIDMDDTNDDASSLKNYQHDMNEAFTQRRDSRTPLKITPKLQQDHFDPLARCLNSSINGPLPNQKDVAQSPQTSPHVRKVIRKFNPTHTTTIFDVGRGYRVKQADDDSTHQSRMNHLGQSANRFSIDAEEEIKPCITESTMNMELSAKNGSQPFTNRYKKK